MFVIWQCNRTVKGTVNTSCLCKWTEHVMYCCLALRRVNYCFFFLFLFLLKTYNHNPCLVSFSNFVRTTEWIGLRSVLTSSAAHVLKGCQPLVPDSPTQPIFYQVPPPRPPFHGICCDSWKRQFWRSSVKLWDKLRRKNTVLSLWFTLPEICYSLG